MSDSTANKRVMIIAGEPSGDFHGANVVREIKRYGPVVEFFGIGGKAMSSEGVDILVDCGKLSVVGITEVFSKLPYLKKAVNQARRMLGQLRPDLLILIDFPDFNLYVASIAKKIGVPVLYYISPQVWAWRSGRVKRIRALVDHMAVILPFERDFYLKHGVPASFVGHPLLDQKRQMVSPKNFQKHSSSPWPVIGLLPGSRESEITRLLPVMLDAARLIKKRFPSAKFLLSLAYSLDLDFVNRVLEQNRQDLEIEMVEGGAAKTYLRCTMVIAASGTVTLETAMAGVPMIIIYRVSPLSYKLAKSLIKVDYVSLTNIIVGRELVPELLQDEASKENIARVAANMLENPDALEKMSRELIRVRKRLGGPGASKQVARIALNMLNA